MSSLTYRSPRAATEICFLIPFPLNMNTTVSSVEKKYAGLTGMIGTPPNAVDISWYIILTPTEASFTSLLALGHSSSTGM